MPEDGKNDVGANEILKHITPPPRPSPTRCFRTKPPFVGKGPRPGLRWRRQESPQKGLDGVPSKGGGWANSKNLKSHPAVPSAADANEDADEDDDVEAAAR